MAKNSQVEEWFAKYENPMKDVVLRVRDLLLRDGRLDECIKWQSPTFTFNGNFASFNPRSKSHASLMFHTGAQLPGKHPQLEGGAGTARFLKITSLEHADSLQADLQALVDAWCELKGATQASAPTSAKSKKRTPRASKTASPRSATKKANSAAKKPPRVTTQQAGSKATRKRAVGKTEAQGAARASGRGTASMKASTNSGARGNREQ